MQSKLRIACLLVVGFMGPLYAAVANSTAGKSNHKHASKHHKRKLRVKAHSPDYMQGTASYYAAKFATRRMSNGKHLDLAEYTAAHPSLPFGSKLKVTNLATGKSIYVEVSDRLPKKSGHVIDLTPAGAEALGFKRRGVAKVTLIQVSENEFESEQAAQY